jgi:hypothetical protein
MYRADEDTWTESSLQDGELSPDDAFRVLAHHHRRIIVTSLLGNRHGVSVDALIEDVLVHDDLSGDPADTRRRIAAKLHHVHLPRLADVGLVEWDRDHDVVTPTARLPALEPLVEA